MFTKTVVWTLGLCYKKNIDQKIYMAESMTPPKCTQFPETLLLFGWVWARVKSIGQLLALHG